MAKFCGNCGAQLDDDARVCGQCGTPFAGRTARVSGLKIVDPEKQRKVKKRIMLAILLAVVVAIIILAFSIISNFTGSKGFVRRVMTAIEDYDIDTLVSVSSDMYYYGDESAAESYFESNVNFIWDSIEETTGHSSKFDYKINEIYNMSEREKRETIKLIESTYPDFDVNVIEKMKAANVSILLKDGSRTNETIVRIEMVKEEGKWKLLHLY